GTRRSAPGSEYRGPASDGQRDVRTGSRDRPWTRRGLGQRSRVRGAGDLSAGKQELRRDFHGRASRADVRARRRSRLVLPRPATGPGCAGRGGGRSAAPPRRTAPRHTAAGLAAADAAAYRARAGAATAGPGTAETAPARQAGA